MRIAFNFSLILLVLFLILPFHQYPVASSILTLVLVILIIRDLADNS
jgi:hypothetical protein